MYETYHSPTQPFITNPQFSPIQNIISSPFFPQQPINFSCTSQQPVPFSCQSPLFQEIPSGNSMPYFLPGNSYIPIQSVYTIPVVFGTLKLVGVAVPVQNQQDEVHSPSEDNTELTNQTPFSEDISIDSINTAINGEVPEAPMPIDVENEVQETTRPVVQKNSRKIKKTKPDLPKVPKKAEVVLKKWFMENFNDPYPMPNEKVMLAKECGMSINQISAWFKTVRQRQNKIPCKFSVEIERALRNQL